MSVELEKGKDLKFEFWKSNIKALSEDFKCHLWCNERGDLPTAIPVSNVKSELMESLVNALVNFFRFLIIKNFLKLSSQDDVIRPAKVLEGQNIVISSGHMIKLDFSHPNMRERWY